MIKLTARPRALPPHMQPPVRRRQPPPLFLDDPPHHSPSCAALPLPLAHTPSACSLATDQAMRACKRCGGAWSLPLCSLLLLLLASAAAGQQPGAAPGPALSPDEQAALLQEAEPQPQPPAAAPAPAAEAAPQAAQPLTQQAAQPLPADAPESLVEEWNPAEVDAALAAVAGGAAAKPRGGGELPDDVAALLGPQPGGGEGGANASGPAAERPPPGERVSEMISLLSPPPGFQPSPPLSDAQQAAIPLLRQNARQGTATVSYLRSALPPPACLLAELQWLRRRCRRLQTLTAAVAREVLRRDPQARTLRLYRHQPPAASPCALHHRSNVGNLDGSRMACGLGYLNDHFKQHFVGERAQGSAPPAGNLVRVNQNGEATSHQRPLHAALCR